MNAKGDVGKAAADAKQRPAKSGRRRPRRRSLSNEEFLARALDLFFELGFEGASVEAITAAAGIAKRTVYLRYGDKKSLFKAALRRAIEEWIVPVERLREAESGALEESLLAIGHILVDNILSPAGLRLLRLTNAESGRMPEIGAYNVHQGTDRTISYLADLFRRHLGQDRTGFPEAENAAEAFLNLVVGGPASMAVWGVERDKSEIDRRTRFSVRIFLHGLLLPPQESISADVFSTLGDENLRLKKLLAETMLRLDQTRERLERDGSADGPAEHESVMADTGVRQ